MKLKNIFFAGLAVTALASCSDYLDVDAPSKYDDAYVFSTQIEIPKALNGVYAQLMSGDMYGSAYFTTFQLNSDVDFGTKSTNSATTDSYARFDCSSAGSAINKMWSAAYRGIEYANNFINKVEASPLYVPTDEHYAENQQMVGEAKCIRAMFFYDLIWYFGDVPFSFKNTDPNDAENSVMPVADRKVIQDALIADLKEAAEHMQYAKDLDYKSERCSKEFAWGMIARLAMQAGGYTLRPDGNTYGKMERPTNWADYYDIAIEYTDSIIKNSGRSVGTDYAQVFVNQCNYIVDDGTGDIIFEIPFAAGSSGDVGYAQGPTNTRTSDGSTTANAWGYCSGGTQVSYFYRFFFDDADARRSYVNGMWYYDSEGVPTLKYGYTLHNNKWSKLWQQSPRGNTTAGSTGINYPYLRYTDVLLTYAEAINERYQNPDWAGACGKTAKDVVKEVRARAFANDPMYVDIYVDDNSLTPEDFKKLVLNERKFEFAGENMRWKDLVRNNIYNKEIFWTYLRYRAVALSQASMTDQQMLDAVAAHDGINVSVYENLPMKIYAIVCNNGDIDATKFNFPNTTLKGLDIFNPDEAQNDFSAIPSKYKGSGDNFKTVEEAFNWVKDDGNFQDAILFSLYGYIRGGEVDGNTYIVSNGNTVRKNDLNDADLPVLRYILPYPNDAIQRSGGVYKNQYGYSN